MRSANLVTLAALVLSLFLAGSPSAQAASTDPSAGSPSGVLYELPVDIGRRDAAPQPPASGESGPVASSSSSYRSENNFGTSSRVPGAKGGVAAAAALPFVDSGNHSAWLNLLLLALVLTIGAILGVVAWGRRRDAAG